jgi:hypothetical protein
MRTLAFLIALPLAAELHTLRVEFEPSGCASCLENLEARLKRMRGVETVKLEGGSAVEMRMAEGNRVRLEIVRDFIEQGAGKVKRMSLEATGAAVDGGGAPYFELWDGGARYRVEGAAKTGRVRAEIADTRQLVWKIAP